MNKVILFVALLACSAANAKNYDEIAEMEAGSERSIAVATDQTVLAVVASLSKQPSQSCSLEQLTSTVSDPQVLVGFFKEANKDGVELNKFVVGIKCSGSEQLGDIRYDLVGIIGDGGYLIESLQLN